MTNEFTRLELLSNKIYYVLETKIIIIIDHDGLLSNTSANDRVFRWKQKIEEFGPTLKYVQEQYIMKANVLSRLPTMEESYGVDILLSTPLMDPYYPILNKYILDLKLLHKYQQLDQHLLKDVGEDRKISSNSIYGNQVIVYQPLRSDNQMKIMMLEAVKYCPFHQNYKMTHHSYGYLPLKNVQYYDFWDEVYVDMI